jgi:signal peptidase II
MKRVIIAFWTIGLVFIDQAIKWWIIQFYPSSVYMNNGIIFGFINNQIICITLLVLGILALIWISLEKKKEPWQEFALTLVFAGALSNIIDRIYHSAVVDYITIKGVNTFNLADIYIILGVIIYSFQIFRKK